MNPGCRIVARPITMNEGPPMSRSPDEAHEEPLDLERLVIDADYGEEVMLRLKDECLARRAQRLAAPACKRPIRR
jgi:hypothetical protein